MSDLQEKVEKAIRETLADPEGAGSDLYECEPLGPGSQWLIVRGNLDVQHLASHVIQTIDGLLVEAAERGKSKH